MLNFIKSRDNEIDLLRFLGLTMIILAHVNPPELLFQIRAFDVPLMLFVSGLAYSGKQPDFSISFLYKRIKRLVFPVWIFLTVYFGLVLTMQHFGLDFGVRKHHIIGSYTFMEGIGYVWIIRIFLIVSLLTPVLLFISNKIESDLKFYLVCLTILVIDEVSIIHGIGVDNLFVREFIFYGVGYSLMFLMGSRCRKMSTTTTTYMTGLLAIGYSALQLIDYQQNGGVLL